jgi:predicted metal-dependent peptidase
METSSPAELEQRVLRARIQLALHQPFLASAVMRLPIRAAANASWCPTMSTDGYRVFYNPRWTTALTDDELRGVIAHEVLHVVFAHEDRQQDRTHARWNIACDHAINLLLTTQGFALPKGGMYDRAFEGLPAEEIYERLPKDVEHGQAGCVEDRDEDLGEDGDEDGGKDRLSGALVGIGPDLVSPNDPRIAALRDADTPDREQLTALRETLRTEAIGRLHGLAAAYFREECEASNRSRIDWRELLRSWLSDRILTDWRTFPFSRKHLVRGLYMPSLGVESPGHIVFAIDTSGSMDSEDLADIFGELRAFRETFPCRLTVIQCDADIQEITEYAAMDGTEVPDVIQVKGRGGTRFEPVFEWVAENVAGGMTVLLYATDGYGSYWAKTPHWPVVWLMTERGREVPYGWVIEI